MLGWARGVVDARDDAVIPDVLAKGFSGFPGESENRAVVRVWRPELRRHRRAVVYRPTRRLGHWVASVEVPVGIHPLVEYAHHIDHVVGANPVVKRVRSDSVLAVARANVIAGPPDRRIGDDAFDRTLDFAQVLLSLIVIPPLRAVIPDLF